MNPADNENEVWTVKRMLEWMRGYLERKGDENPRVSSEWLLSEACDLRRIDLYLNPDRPLDAAERDVLRGFVARRGAGEPLQYITGEAPFRYLTVKVRPGVLIPRPETEVLVSEALSCLPAAGRRQAAWSAESSRQEAAAVAELKERLAAAQEGGAAAGAAAEAGVADAAGAGAAGAGAAAGDRPEDAAAPLLVADICTGSGCIACAIASERPDARVIAVDVAPEAVALARENAAALGLADSVKVLQGDLGAPVPERYLGRFDLVVSNPPYVPTAVLADMPREVAEFEPALALDGGADGLDLFRRLVPWAASALKPGGGFACELHETCLDDAAAIAQAVGFSDVRVVRDLAERPRVLVCRR